MTEQPHQRNSRPLLALTMGDPAGVGPETIVGAWESPKFHAACQAIVLGHPGVIERAAAQRGNRVRVVEIASPEDVVADDPSIVSCIRCCSESALEVPPATVDPRGGQAAVEALDLAIDLALDDGVAAITTAPIHKAALRSGGYTQPGHTELLAQRCGVDDVAMMLYLSRGSRVRGRVGLGVVHATLHNALRDVFSSLNIETITRRIRQADEITKVMLAHHGIGSSPSLAVAALNPHGGEMGLFGSEESTVIGPAVEQAQREEIPVSGPFPVDTLMVRAANGEFDNVVAMYHDQGHIALKLLGMYEAVNVTLGLPIVRTSVAHGTAFDLAWQGQANCSGMIEAVRLASELSSARNHTMAFQGRR